jgi:hypothetical protein
LNVWIDAVTLSRDFGFVWSVGVGFGFLDHVHLAPRSLAPISCE